MNKILNNTERCCVAAEPHFICYIVYICCGWTGSFQFSYSR